jgi:hypothetical protein
MIQANSQSDNLFFNVVESKVGRELEDIEVQLQKFKRRSSAVDYVNFQELSGISEYPYFLFENRRLIYWSDYHYTPKYVQIAGKFDLKYTEDTKGKYLLIKDFIGKEDEGKEVVFVLPLYTQPRIINNYLKSEHNRRIFAHKDFEIMDITEESSSNVISYKDQALFEVSFGPSYQYLSSLLQVSIYVLLLALFVLRNINTTKGSYC